ncbi:activator of s-phase kinase-related [Anaeramoeba flamelloides]|uniref:Activator of s-phase kinase-related n=1 Tax=Anaeramoeba flamelloides TaxID=1746091 RepID=A0AAV7ZJ94_9EUKA|nr:activator of s-phase kinase-related [Anaeramoeba flamelloides]
MNQKTTLSIFYLHIENLTIKKEILKKLKLLGAKVSTFLDHRVRFLVTDRPVKKMNTSKPITPSSPHASVTSTPSRVGNCSPFQQPRTPLSICKKNKSKRLSQLLSKNNQRRNNQKTDFHDKLITTARKLKIKILSVQQIRGWLRKKLPENGTKKEISNQLKDYLDLKKKINNKILKLKEINQPKTQTTNQFNLRKTSGLRKTFDFKSKSYPNLTTHQSKLDLLGKESLYPFLMISDDKQLYKQLSKEFTLTSIPTTVTFLDKFSRLRNKDFSLENLKKIREKPQTKVIKQKRAKTKLKGSGFCEICKQRYQNMDEHTKSLKHKTFAQNESNFLQVDELFVQLRTENCNNNNKKESKIELRNQDDKKEMETKMKSEKGTENEKERITKNKIDFTKDPELTNNPEFSNNKELANKSYQDFEKENSRFTFNTTIPYSDSIPSSSVESDLCINSEYESEQASNTSLDFLQVNSITKSPYRETLLADESLMFERKRRFNETNTDDDNDEDQDEDDNDSDDDDDDYEHKKKSLFNSQLSNKNKQTEISNMILTNNNHEFQNNNLKRRRVFRKDTHNPDFHLAQMYGSKKK